MNTTGGKTDSGSLPKSLGDILAEELDGKLGDEHTQELPVAEKQERLKAVFERIHREQPTRSALCLSGGGIRSATFGLGILQGLAHCGLLDKFHYLSTVSGGGYIGSWLSAWIKNHPEGIRGVVAELAKSARTNESPTNTPHGKGGVVAESPELKRLHDSVLNPDPPPIRHLRKFSNYLAPQTGLMSVDFWTLITTFIRNIFLNWLVLISLLGAVLMIPRFYLVTLSLAPDWAELAKKYQENPPPDWAAWAKSVNHHWDMGLSIFLAVGFALVAIAMAYAIIDVPSTGNAQLPQRRFLIFRQLPLLLASLILAAWWAVFRNVHGSEPFQSRALLGWFVCFTVASYLFGGVLAWASLLFLNRGDKAGPGRPTDEVEEMRESSASLLRVGTIVLTAVFAGFCLWAMATKMFLEPPIAFTLRRDCEATQISSGKKMTIPEGTQGLITQFRQGNYTAEIPQGSVRIGQEHLDALDMEQAPRAGFPAPAPAQHALNYVCFGPPLILGVLMLVNFLFTGLASKVTKDEDREWWGRSAAWILITIVGWIVFNVIVLWGAQAITATTTGNQLQVFLGQVQTNPVSKAVLGAFGGVSGIAAALLALRSKLGKKLDQKGGFQSVLVLVGVVFFLLLSVVISWALLVISSRPLVQDSLRWDVGTTWHGEHLFVVSFLTGITLIFGIVMGFFINANTFSLHAIYRNRLIRAYLAASCKTGDRKDASPKTRKPDLFAGFDPEDNFELHKLSLERPLHVLNGTLNLVKGGELAWQERKGESFTMSRLHCGSWHVGYRPSTEYGNDGKGVTLGTALAISGAAANPSMGYHSSPIVGFLMTLFNVRLGWWLGNPGRAGAKTWQRSGPHYSVGPLFSEAMGNTTDCYKYVNLSDGGHFENLGLYEMVLRRCRYIVVSDAGEDPDCSFADLGEAIRKIRIDFGIPIEFDRMSIYPRSQIDALRGAGQKGHSCAIGRIRYSAVDEVKGKKASDVDGTIVYIKPACYGDEPRDIYEYFTRSKTFPHESTTDQFFSESQFESYRMLGLYTIQSLCKNPVEEFPDFIHEIQENLKSSSFFEAASRALFPTA